MGTDEEWAQLARSRYVALCTFRRSGVAVSTPVWIAAEGTDLVVTTHLGTGKVKRLRNDPRVTVQPCGMRGTVDPKAPLLHGVAVLAGEDARAEAALASKYGVQFRLLHGVERLIAWVRRKPVGGVILRIRTAP